MLSIGRSENYAASLNTRELLLPPPPRPPHRVYHPHTLTPENFSRLAFRRWHISCTLSQVRREIHRALIVEREHPWNRNHLTKNSDQKKCDARVGSPVAV